MFCGCIALVPVELIGGAEIDVSASSTMDLSELFFLNITVSWSVKQEDSAALCRVHFIIGC